MALVLIASLDALENSWKAERHPALIFSLERAAGLALRSPECVMNLVPWRMHYLRVPPS